MPKADDRDTKLKRKKISKKGLPEKKEEIRLAIIGNCSSFDSYLEVLSTNDFLGF